MIYRVIDFIPKIRTALFGITTERVRDPDSAEARDEAAGLLDIVGCRTLRQTSNLLICGSHSCLDLAVRTSHRCNESSAGDAPR